MNFELANIYNYNIEIILNITILYYQYIGEKNNILKNILNTFKTLSDKVINEAYLKNTIKNIYKNDTKSKAESRKISYILHEIIPIDLDTFLLQYGVLCPKDKFYCCKLETILSIVYINMFLHK